MVHSLQRTKSVICFALTYKNTFNILIHKKPPPGKKGVKDLLCTRMVKAQMLKEDPDFFRIKVTLLACMVGFKRHT